MTLTSYKSSKSYQNLGQNLGQNLVQNRGLCGALFALIALFFLTACGASAALDDLARQLSEYEPPAHVAQAQKERQRTTVALAVAETAFESAREAERVADAGDDEDAKATAEENRLKAEETLRLAKLEQETAQKNDEKITTATVGQARRDALAKQLEAAKKAAAEDLQKAQDNHDNIVKAEAPEEKTQQSVVIGQEFSISSATADEPTVEQVTPTPTEAGERAKSSSDSDFLDAMAKLEKRNQEEAALRLAKEVRYELWQRETAKKYDLTALDIAPSWTKRYENQFLRNPYNGRDEVNYYDYRRPGPHIGVSGYDHVSKRTDDKALLGGGTNNVLGDGTSITGGYSYFNGIWSIDDAYWWAIPWTGAYRSYYATIHQDTNVGDILPTHIPKALWKVNFSAIKSETWAYTGDNNRDTIVETTFPMEIDFVHQTFAATIKYKYYKIHNYEFRIDGYYDKNGFVQGDIFNNWDDANNTRGDFGDGKITGLIGDKGMVAVFISDQRTGYREKHFGYSGGFVACPTRNNLGTGLCKARQTE